MIASAAGEMSVDEEEATILKLDKVTFTITGIAWRRGQS